MPRGGPQPPKFDLPPWLIQAHGVELRAANWRLISERRFVVTRNGEARVVTLVAESYGGKWHNGQRGGRSLVVRPHARDRDWLFAFERELLRA